MTRKHDIEQWCRDAAGLLRTPDLPDAVQKLRYEAIDRHAGTSRIYAIAQDLAEGLSHLPVAEREAGNRVLLERYGVGYEVFVEARFQALRSAIRRGHLRDDADYANALELAGDVTLADELRASIRDLLYAFELNRKG